MPRLVDFHVSSVLSGMRIHHEKMLKRASLTQRARIARNSQKRKMDFAQSHFDNLETRG